MNVEIVEQIAPLLGPNNRPDKRFWDLWRSNKWALKDAGIGVTKNNEGEWEVRLPSPDTDIDANLIEGLGDWSEEQAVETVHGARMLRSADVTPELLALWRKDEYSMRRLGLSPDKNDPSKLVWFGGFELDQEQIEASYELHTDREYIKPDGLEYRGFQKAGIEFALSRDAVLFGDEMGLGKTIQALGVINNNPELRRVFVVCPASLRPNWMNEIRKWCVRSPAVIPVNTVDDIASIPDEGEMIVVTNYNRLSKMVGALRELRFDGVIADEAHYVKNPKSQRHKALANLCGNDAVKLFLTGTPALNKPEDLYPLLKILDPGHWGSRSAFLKRYCGAQVRRIRYVREGRMQSRHILVATEATNTEELAQRLRGTVMVRRLKRDVLKELPEKQRTVIKLAPSEFSAEVRDQIDLGGKSLSQSGLALTSLRADPVAFEEVSRAYQYTGLAKAGFVARYVGELVSENPDHKVVLFAHHKSVVAQLRHILQEEYSVDPLVVVGSTSEKHRELAADRFQNDPSCPVFLGNILAAGVGLTLTASQHVVFAELSWRPADIQQAEDRAHRITQRGSVVVEYFIADTPQSLDHNLVGAIMGKEQASQRILDSRVEVDGDGGEVWASEREQALEEAIREALASPAPLAHPFDVGFADEALRGLTCLHEVCDGVQQRDGMGFSAVTREPAVRLLRDGIGNGNDLNLAIKICTRHRRQLEGLGMDCEPLIEGYGALLTESDEVSLSR